MTKNKVISEISLVLVPANSFYKKALPERLAELAWNLWRLGLYRISIWYSVSAEYLNTR